jgi:hypothetical protein
MQAAGGASTKYDMIVKALGTIQGFLERLKIHLRHHMDTSLGDIAIRVLVQILVLLASVTRTVRQGRFCERDYGSIASQS